MPRGGKKGPRPHSEAANVPADELFVVDKAGNSGDGKKKKKKGSKAQAEGGPSEAELEELLFGGSGFGPNEGKEGAARRDLDGGGEGGKEEVGGGEGDDGGGSDSGGSEMDVGKGQDSDGEMEGGGAGGQGDEAATQKAAVWHDDDDEEVEVDIAGTDRLRKLRQSEEEVTLGGVEYAERLKKQFGKMSGEVSWATRKRARRVGEQDDDDDGGEELLRGSGGMLAKRGALLPQAVLDVQRMADANQADVSDCVVQSVRFHPSSRLMLSAGLDKRLRLFQVDGKKNAKVQSVFFEDLPISSAEFSGDGGQVYLTGRRRHFYSYDLGAAKITKVEGVAGWHEKSMESMVVSPDGRHIAVLGNCGKVGVLSTKTKACIFDLHMNHSARAAAFSPDGNHLYSGGGGGLVYVWDMRMRRCVRKIADEGSVGVSAIACAPAGGLLAIGSTSGVVNTYDAGTLDQLGAGDDGTLRPVSRRGIMNLTTRIDCVRFNPDAQAFGMSSHAKKQSMRLVHSASSTVFANWPTAGTPLHYVSTFDFSNQGGYVAIGNDRGKVLLYRMKHYSTGR